MVLPLPSSEPAIFLLPPPSIILRVYILGVLFSTSSQHTVQDWAHSKGVVE